MGKSAKITDVIKRLNTLLLKHGDLEVYSVNYHSDYEDVPLEVGNEDQIKVVTHPHSENGGVCIICGGGY